MKRFLVSLLIVQNLAAQTPCIEMDAGIEGRLKAHVDFLASDELKGRKPGTKEIDIAGNYIIQILSSYGLQPAFNGEYRQPFDIPGIISFSESNILKVKNKAYELNLDFFPTTYSSNGAAKGRTVYVGFGIEAPSLEHNDYEGLDELEGKVFVMDVSSPDGIHPHSKYVAYSELGERIKLAKSKGAVGVILVNLEGGANDISPKFRKISDKGLPVIFIQNEKLAKKIRKKKDVNFAVDIKPNPILAYNIGAFLNNGAPRTVIIGAHYDHLGMGGEGSLFSGAKPEVHNGADDNASGIAGMLELAGFLTSREAFKTNNYLFLAFSGEEMGLLGSKSITKNGILNNFRPNYMINLDMIGRLENNQLAVNGTGTSWQWKKLISEGCGLRVKTSESGVGPSDHTSFYYINVPALHFFTGTHSDYHKPSDDAQFINHEGIHKVLAYILGVISRADGFEMIEFQETDVEDTEVPRFSVTLGIMPDYMYEEEGVMVDGVTKGKPADKGGIVAGDVIIKLGDVPVVDMMSYMQGLSRYKKGDKVEVGYMRDGKKKVTEIKF